MVRAYCAIITGVGTSERLAEKIAKLPNVSEAHVVAGDFDIIVELAAEDMLDLQRTITADIQRLDGVGTTRTYLQLD